MVPIVLVVDDDERARRLVRTGLELEGFSVIEAESVGRARSVMHPGVRGVVLDRQLPDGDGLDLLPAIGATCPDARVVIHSTIVDGHEPPWIDRADKGDLPAIVDALGFVAERGAGDPARLAVVDLVRAEAEDVVRDWAELCRWDPLLPPDAQPPLARLVVEAVADALQRPQPLGWGPDPALTTITEAFAESAGAIDVAIGQLICLREAFRRHVVGHVPPGEEMETQARVDMIIDRAIWTAARVTAVRVSRQLQMDPITGLPNRVAFDRDATRELSRASRYRRPVALMLVEMPSGDPEVTVAGEPPGAVEGLRDAQARRVATALAANLRTQDRVYRVGANSFAVLAPEADVRSASAILERLRTIPGVSVSCSTFPEDGDDLVVLVDEAERRITAPGQVSR